MKEEFAWKMWAAEQLADNIINDMFLCNEYDMHTIWKDRARYIADLLKMEVFRK